MHEKLQKSNVIAVSAISGMGGVGKTELATQYARKYEADYAGGICWLNAGDNNLASEIIKFYQLYVDNKRKIPTEIAGRPLENIEQAIWCWHNWQPPEGLILVVWDDVTDLNSCQELMPPTNRFRLLITTRLRNIDPNIVEEISLDVLSSQESIELLSTLLGKKRVEKEIETANQLCQSVGYLPLALDLVGRYIADDPDLSLKQMLVRIKQQKLDDEAFEHPSNSWTTAQRGVKAAFELTWQKLDRSVQRVAELLSLFAADAIPWYLVEDIFQRLDGNIKNVNQAKKQLYKHHLITSLERGDSYYTIHPLIRQFLQAKRQLLASADDYKRAFANEILEIAKKIPEDMTRQLITEFSPIIPHFLEVVKYLTPYLSDDDVIWPFIYSGRFFQGQGLYTQLEEIYKLSLAIIKQRFPYEHPQRASILNHLGSVYHDKGRYRQANALYQEALKIRLSLFGEEHIDIANSLNDLALLLTELEEYEKAEKFHLKALNIRRRLLGERHLDFTDSLNNLAMLYDEQGLSEKSEPLFIKSLTIRQELLGQEHPRMVTSLNNLASCYYWQGKYKNAEKVYVQALKLSQKIFIDGHYDIANILNNLAQTYAKLGKYQQAEKYFIQALRQQKQIWGQEHPQIATLLNNLASLYEDIGNISKAELLYQQSLNMRIGLLGDNHSDVAISLNNLAKFYFSQKRYVDSKPLYIKSVNIVKEQLGVEHPLSLKVQSNLDELEKVIKNNERGDY